MRFIKVTAWAFFFAAIALYITMQVWTLATLNEFTGGIAIFDLRPGGYSLEDAQELLAALGAEGRLFYRESQQMLDSYYPALYGMALFLALFIFSPDFIGKWRFVLPLLAIPGTIFDYLENSMVRFMLFLGPNNINEQIVGWASERTLRKSMFTSVALVVFILVLVYWAWKRFSYKPKNS